MYRIILFIRKVHAFALAIIAMFSTVVPVAPSPNDYENEYAVHATVYTSTPDITVFKDDAGRRWSVDTNGETYLTDTPYVLVVYNNTTQETSDDYVVTVMRYFPTEEYYGN